MIDTELEPVRLVQAEAIDILVTQRFLSFDNVERFDNLDVVLMSIDGTRQVGTVRSFWSHKELTVLFLVTLDYRSPERLLLEQDQLGICVAYEVSKAEADTDSGFYTVQVKRFGVRQACLIQAPQKPNDGAVEIHLALRPVKQWRWR